MNCSGPAVLCGVLLMLVLAVPVSGAVTPLWRITGPTNSELSGVVISDDGSTILVGGDELISLTQDGRKRWSGWSGTCLAISANGDYILASQGQVVRLISSGGSLIWEEPVGLVVTDLSMAPNASIIAAAGGGRVRTMTLSKNPIASNVTMSVNHIRVMPAADRILITTNKNIQLSNFSLIAEWSDSNATQNLIGVSREGSFFVTANFNRVWMYNRTGGLIWDRKLPSGNVQALAYSRDGSTIVLGMDDGRVHVLDREGTELWSASTPGWITSVAVSGDGNTIAAGSMDKKLYVYNHAGTELGTFPVQSPVPFNSVAVTADGSLIVVVDDKGAYGLSRSSFIEESATPAIAATTTEFTEETTAPATTAATRKQTTLPWTIPTPFETTATTEEADLSCAVVIAALGLLLFCRFRKD